ncbi:DUF6328 family protein [Myxococcus stipitatus]|uniref:DUF6328 family protein n=1 Tax=Myxococcus stipitatus TaxID=83455 RepID=UPI001F46A78C|nr:DUF6328 family protein [Myxococcus stipitatus]MCE9672603.1 DUF6328 family protein [Myxococcus stipitatus]
MRMDAAGPTSRARAIVDAHPWRIDRATSWNRTAEGAPLESKDSRSHPEGTMTRPELTTRIQQSLDETRILMLGTQVLMGFGFRMFFEEGYESLPRGTHFLMLVELSLLLLAVVLLITPGNYHRIVERGQDTPRLHRFVTRLLEGVVLPIIAALAILAFVAGEKVLGRAWGVTLGLGTAMVAFALLYGLEAADLWRKRNERRRTDMDDHHEARGQTELKDRIQHVLTEARVILPGVQALLGFQFTTVLMPAFEKLPASSRYVHLAALVMMTVSILFLLAPAAYHRMVEHGEDTERFHRFASRMILAATVTLALGLAGDFFIIVRKVTGSLGWALGATAVFLLCAYGLWFGFTLARRARDTPRPPASHPGRLHGVRG